VSIRLVVAGLNLAALVSWLVLGFALDRALWGAVGAAVFLLAAQAVLITSRRQETSREDRERILHEAERGRKLAIYDPSTGLLAQWYFELRLDEELARGNRYGLPLVVITLEGEAANSESAGTGGFGAGTVASAVAGAVRRTDLVSTIGFSQFAICLVHCNRAGAVPMIRRLMTVLGDGEWRIGIAVHPDDDCSAKELLSLATRRAAPWKAASTRRAA
jgi:GGDEF domain-containing protein